LKAETAERERERERIFVAKKEKKGETLKPGWDRVDRFPKTNMENEISCSLSSP
jgi:hypothetical protein